MNQALPFARIRFGFFICFVFVLFFDLSWASGNSEFDRLKRAAEGGDIEAQYLIGAAYFYGDNIKKVKSIDYKGEPVQQDMIKADRWLKKPAEQGYEYAPFLMGSIYESQFQRGNVFDRKAMLDQDGEEAVRWYHIGAQKRHKPSRDRMTHLMRDWDVELKAAPAPVANINHVMKNAVKGNADAQYRLGLMYAKGEGVDQDFQKAGKWFYQAAANGHAKAQDNIGYLYYRGHGVKQDSGKAIEWYLKALVQDYPESAFMLGRIYHKGEGVPKDTAKGFRYLQKAAELGHPKGQNHMGYCYATGECPSIPMNLDKAIEWFTKAVDQGDKEAMMNLTAAEYEKSLAGYKRSRARHGGGSGFSLPKFEMKDIFAGAAVLTGVLWLQSAIDEVADSQTQIFDKADPECKNKVLSADRVIKCLVLPGSKGQMSIQCDGKTLGIFTTDKMLGCFNSVDRQYCDEGNYDKYCSGANVYCDTATHYISENFDELVNRICN